MGTVAKEVFFGIYVALFAMIGGLLLYLEYFTDYTFQEALDAMRQMDLYGKIISIACIPNLFVFLVFMKKRQDNRAKGVLLVTIIAALTTLVLKFI